MKGAIVTGANGFVGSAVVRELLKNGVSVCAVVHKDHRDNLPEHPAMTVVSCGLDDIYSLLDKIPPNKYEVIYHMAWAGVSGPKRSDISVQLKNALYTVDYLKIAKELSVKRFVFSGSIMEYEAFASVFAGNKPGTGYIYGGGKIAAHTMCKCQAVDMGIDFVCALLTNAYGPGDRSPRLVNTAVQKCIRGEAPQFTAGTQNYDFVYIDDVARAFRLIGEKGIPFHEYLIGSSGAKPLKEFLLEMRAAIAPEQEFKFGDLPFTGVNLPLEKFDCTAIEADTGFKARVSFADGCKRTYDWWKEQIEAPAIERERERERRRPEALSVELLILPALFASRTRREAAGA